MKMARNFVPDLIIWFLQCTSFKNDWWQFELDNIIKEVMIRRRNDSLCVSLPVWLFVFIRTGESVVWRLQMELDEMFEGRNTLEVWSFFYRLLSVPSDDHRNHHSGRYCSVRERRAPPVRRSSGRLETGLLSLPLSSCPSPSRFLLSSPAVLVHVDINLFCDIQTSSFFCRYSFLHHPRLSLNR